MQETYTDQIADYEDFVAANQIYCEFSDEDIKLQSDLMEMGEEGV